MDFPVGTTILLDTFSGSPIDTAPSGSTRTLATGTPMASGEISVQAGYDGGNTRWRLGLDGNAIIATVEGIAVEYDFRINDPAPSSATRGFGQLTQMSNIGDTAEFSSLAMTSTGLASPPNMFMGYGTSVPAGSANLANNTGHTVRAEYCATKRRMYLDGVLILTETAPSSMELQGLVELNMYSPSSHNYIYVSRVKVESIADFGDPPPGPGPKNVLIKDLLSVSVEQLHMIPGTPYVPAQPGRYSYQTQQDCGWVYNGPGHYQMVTSETTGESRLVWIPDNPTNGVSATWSCSLKQVPVWHPPIPAQPATPPTYYSTTHAETSFNLGWNAGARSIGIFTSNAAVQFSVATSVVGVIIGMNIDDGSPQDYNGNAINYGFYLARGTARIIQGGVLGAVLGVYTNDTVFRIERNSTTITWKMDGVSKGTATGALTGAGWLEAAMYSGNDIVYNPSIEQISAPDLTTKNATISGSLPPLTGFMSDRPYAVMAGNLPALDGGLDTGVITPSYCVMGGELTIFSGYMNSLTGELAQIAGSLPPMQGLMADHAYAVIAGNLPPVNGFMSALEGNNRASLNGWAGALGGMATRSILVVSMLNRATIGGVFTTQLRATAEFFSTATMTDLWTFRSIQQAVLWSRAVIQGVQFTTVDGEGEIETWVINMEGDAFGTTQYQNFNFNSYAEIDGHFYGAGRDGLVLLEGDTDDGVPIQSVVSLGKQGSSIRQKKTFEECFLGLSSAGNMFVKVIAEGREYIYKTKAYDPEMQVQRATFGKGLRTNYVTLEIYNEEGADFELDSVQFVAADLSRKT